MSEFAKTSIFGGLAVVLALLATLSRPRQEQLKPEDYRGKVLFESFDDPAKAVRMEFVRYNAKDHKFPTFKVARDKAAAEAWTIPSHEGYPADAKDRMRDAALMLVDLKVLGVASEIKGDHKMFGVIAPDKESVSPGEEGVGEMLTFEDATGQKLASLVIGKKAKNAEGQRFVRVANQDPTYVVKIDPERLSIKFEDWIEKDLLKLQSFDVENIKFNNYSVTRVGNRAALDQKSEISVKQENNEWKMQELIEYQTGKPSKATLAEGEELNKEKLNDVKDAAQKLAIVDVRRKPKGLGVDLKAGKDFLDNEETQTDLMKRGFYFNPNKLGTESELLSANGDVHIGMKDGVEYVLRFGETLATTGEEGGGQDRYLFVTTRVDMSKFPEPELQPLPDAAGAKKEPAAKPADGAAKPAEPAGKPEEKPAAKPAEKPAAEVKPDAKDAPAAKGEPGKPGEKGEPAKKDVPAKTAAEASKEVQESELAKERERITKENQRKIDERNDKLKKAQQRVAELNGRFSDWYYVVAETEYKKIHIERSDIVKLSDKAKEQGTDVGAFRKLQQDGLKGEAPLPKMGTTPFAP